MQGTTAARSNRLAIMDRMERHNGIQLSGVERSYGPVKAVRGIDLEIGRGETVALLGPNGAGKSTTIDLILGLGRPDRGTVTVMGLPPTEAVAAGHVAAMLQTGAVIQMLTVREVVQMFAALYPNPRPVDEVLAHTGLTGLADRRTEKLSGGEIQRARFALALVSGAELLVLDEPTVALDGEGRREFWAAMRRVAAEGATVLFATHYLEEADLYSDRVVLMANGRIVADGPSTEIKAIVGTRTIRATLPDVDLPVVAALPGVASAERRGESVELRCTDSDAALRRLLIDHPAARDIEVRGAALEDAFVELTRQSSEAGG
jgi:ABC-2 type transport system ATP-binding protein